MSKRPFKHYIFNNDFPVEDPHRFANGETNFPPQAWGRPNQNYFRLDTYRATTDFIIEPEETVIIHFNSGHPLAYIRADGTLALFSNRDLSFSLTNIGRSNHYVTKNRPLSCTVEQFDIISHFCVSSLAYRYRLIDDAAAAAVEPPE